MKKRILIVLAVLALCSLAQAQGEAALYKDRWMRLAAEFENYKKRTARESHLHWPTESAHQALTQNADTMSDPMVKGDHQEHQRRKKKRAHGVVETRLVAIQETRVRFSLGA